MFCTDTLKRGKGQDTIGKGNLHLVPFLITVTLLKKNTELF